MSRRSIEAFSAPEKVAAYDAGMELMHPNRSKMVEVALEILPLEADTRLTALELGAGTGYFTARFLEAYPRAKVIAVDGAEAMLELAKARLGERATNVDFQAGDFRDLRALVTDGFDVAYSSYALHHLDRLEKMALIREVLTLLLFALLCKAPLSLGPSKWLSLLAQDNAFDAKAGATAATLSHP